MFVTENEINDMQIVKKILCSYTITILTQKVT